MREATGLATAPLHRLRGTDPNWRFEQIVAEERRRGATGSTFFVLAAHHDPHDGAAPEAYDRLRPQLVETLRDAGARDRAARQLHRRRRPGPPRCGEGRSSKSLAGPLAGHRYHYLRARSAPKPRARSRAGLRYDTTLGFPDAVGFRAGIARPFRPWDFEQDAPLDLVEVPLAAMDATLAEERYLGLSAKRAEPQLMRLLDWAAAHGGAFAILWHPDRFDPRDLGGWDRLYSRLLDGVQERGGNAVPAAELVSSHST